MIWPTPYPMTTTLVTGVETTCLELPLRLGRTARRTPAFRPAEKREVRTDARDLGSDVWPQGTNEWKRDAARGIVTYT